MTKRDMKSEINALKALVFDMEQKMQSNGDDDAPARREEVSAAVQTEKVDRRRKTSRNRMQSVHAKAKALDRLIAEGKLDPQVLEQK